MEDRGFLAKKYTDRMQNTQMTALSGIGPAKAKAYAKMGIYNFGDLINHYPRAYENRGDIKLLSEAALVDGKSAVVLIVATEPKVTMLPRRLSMLKFRAYDDSGTAEITFFNQNFLKDKFTMGMPFRFYGKVELKGRRYTITSPIAEYYDEERPPKDLVSVYRLTEGIGINQITKDMERVMSACIDSVSDPMPAEILREYSLCDRQTALKNIHFPENYMAIAKAKRRLVFDEFFNFALCMALTKQQNRPHGAPACTDLGLSEFVKCLPYELTNAQKRAINEICRDMKTDVAMNRMLVGDVGCGKTVCAAAAMYIAVKNHRQAVLMAPTEILARQHYADLSELFGKLNIECQLLIGATSAAQKRKIKERLSDENESTRLNVVIGTQALLSEGVEFSAPGIVITDEQHRFGVNQRAKLACKNENAHLLVMSATPIPRSMALIMYGDLDVSKIDEMPKGRQRVDTFAVDESYRARLQNFIEKQVNMGGQVYIVCPAIEESEATDAGEIGFSDISTSAYNGEGRANGMNGNSINGINGISGINGMNRTSGINGMNRTPPVSDLPPKKALPELKAVEEYTSLLVKRFPNLRVEFLHGKMQSQRKESIMNDFAIGHIQILVSTTVIEVGVNVPNACLMIIENADRFGLSQLHQLRGRVGRGNRKSYCVLVSEFAKAEMANTVAGKRLRSLCKLYDGYEIAEQDLAMRGPGDFFRSAKDDSIRQSGGIRLNIASESDDSELMKNAFAKACEIAKEDPELKNYDGLREQVETMFLNESCTLN